MSDRTAPPWVSAGWQPDLARAPIERAVQLAAAAWVECPSTADANIRDLYWLAGLVRAAEDPNDGPALVDVDVTPDLGVALAEAVDQWLIRGDCTIRELAATTLAGRLWDLARHARAFPALGDIPPVRALALTLGLWFGCVGMAKLTRRFARDPRNPGGGDVPIGLVSYTLDQRLAGYDRLMQCVAYEDAHDNPWVGRGVACARLFEIKRLNLVVDYWVPPESPYWG